MSRAKLIFIALFLLPCRGAWSTSETVPETETVSHEDAKVESVCEGERTAFKQLGWKLEPCRGLVWKSGGVSVEGRPLMYTEFGDPQSKNTTLIFTMVHADEITPLYIGLQLAYWMADHKDKYATSHVIIAPLVNPDGFFQIPRIRMNHRGVDLNRNFSTRDWELHALNAWKVKYHSDPRRNPGEKAHSEPETLFQEELIAKFKPQKILSVHAPLNFMDYDGPNALSLARFPREYVHSCLKLRKSLGAISSGFFPGSLGNYAGQELGIPTLTLELPTADHRRAERYWQQFRRGIDTMIQFQVPDAPRM